MGRLIVVSNRVADLEKEAQSGGLATALADALSEQKGLWFGWDGTIVEDEAPTGLNLTRQGAVATATQPLTQYEYETYYLGFSNAVLWPICHYRMDLSSYNPAFAEGYDAVNRKFASSLSALMEPDDLVWVHDYHLFPLANHLRAGGAKNRMGFFLHIPFPPPDILSAVPDHEKWFGALFDYDLVGFQTEQDVLNFVTYVETQLGGKDLGDYRYELNGKQLTAKAFPIGIDPDAFRQMAVTPEAEQRIKSLDRPIKRNYVIGVDRLDYSKGLPDRFRAFRRFLERHPQNMKTAVLMQVAPPTREELTAYADIKVELEQLSGSINGEFGDFDWMPVRYIHRTLPRDTLAALFRASKIGLVTPLRDGMNLVAKEYIAAQEADDPGVLILSQFAGAAEDLKEAVIVNPYHVEEVADAIQAAIDMPLAERKERYEALMRRVRDRDVEGWRRSFLNHLREIETTPQAA